MVYYEGLTCPVCNKPFESTDDVVACPQCGLPHHRQCWLIEKQCHEHDKHGTDEQWNRNTASHKAEKKFTTPAEQPQHPQICPHCYTKNAEFAEFCTHCGRNLKVVEWHSAQTTTANEPTISSDNINDEELGALVGVNTQYYLPRFHRIRESGNGGWNWAAFLFGPLWLIYRKQYALGGLLFLFQCILDCASLWLTYPINTAASEAEILSAMAQMMENPMTLPAFFLSVLLLIAHVLLGVKGNHLYLHHCTVRIQKARQETPDLSVTELSSFGGVSLGLTMFFYLLSTALVNGFAALIML